MTDIPYDEYYTKIEDSIIVPKDEFKKETDGKFYSNQLLCYYEEKKGTSDETYYIFNGNKNIKYKLIVLYRYFIKFYQNHYQNHYQRCFI